MAENPTMAFLQQALSVSGANAPVEETALYNQFMQRLIVSAMTIDTSGNITAPFISASPNVTNATGTLAVAHGGTGAVTLTGLVKGNGTSAMTAVTAPSGAVVGTTDGQVLTNKTIAGASNTLTVRLTADVTGTLPVTNGGTGVATATANGVMLGNGTSAQNVTAAGSIGTVLTGMGSSAAPTFQPLSNSICQGRLTLTTGVPVTVTDVTGATTIYFTPYGGNVIALYDGSNGWKWITFAETSLALGTLTSGLPYDVFGFLNGSTLNTELLAWTSTTARATALTTQDGVLVKSGATTRRYLGSFYTTATTTTEDSLTKRFVFNYYNRVARPLRRLESTATWNYSTATWRQANAAAANQVEILNGFAEDEILVHVTGHAGNSAATGAATVGVGENSTSAPATGLIYQRTNVPAGVGSTGTTADLHTIPAVGYTKYVWLEIDSTGSGTTTWAGVSAGILQSGITAQWRA